MIIAVDCFACVLSELSDEGARRFGLRDSSLTKRLSFYFSFFGRIERLEREEINFATIFQF